MKFTINDFRKRYPDHDTCLQEIMNILYGDNYTCPTCQKASKFHRVRGSVASSAGGAGIRSTRLGHHI